MTEVEAPYYYPRYLAAPPSSFPTAGKVGIIVGALMLASFILLVAWRKCKAADHIAGQQNGDPQQDAALPAAEQEVLSEGSSVPVSELDPVDAASFSITLI